MRFSHRRSTNIGGDNMEVIYDHWVLTLVFITALWFWYAVGKASGKQMANLHIVYGAPLSGKTSYVNSVLGYNDIVYDYDAIMRAMTNKAYQETIRGAVPYVLGVRDMMVDKLHDDVYI